ncbi:MAG: SMP-30/gluconolactonase/LRE family protein [Proteobacteria bacterium]|nr:SMP-30/gluconolactonase/LRE family protein [Pseudomonadota bacterium]
MRRALVGSAVALAALIGYLAAWPVPIRPLAWKAPTFAGYVGPHARNQRLAAARRVPLGAEIGPEHIAVGPDGWLYTGTLSGSVLRIRSDGERREVFARTGGRPLGMAFDGNGRLIVADAFRGLLAIERDGRITVLLAADGPEPLAFADAVAVASDGRIFFTDATQRIPARRYGTFDAALLDILEHSCTGRVLEFVPGAARPRVVIGGLCFANGVALSTDERRLYVSETGAYRIWRIATGAHGLEAAELARAPSAEARVLVDNLPGFPDNVTWSPAGRLWVGLTKPRSPVVDALSGWPALRAATLRLPRVLWPVPPAYGHVIAYDDEGHVAADLQDPAGQIPETSGVTERDGVLYIQSLHAGAFGILRTDLALGR